MYLLESFVKQLQQRAMHEEPEFVEQALVRLSSRFNGEGERQTNVRMHLSRCFTLLWIILECRDAKLVLDDWTASPEFYVDELNHALLAMRGQFSANLNGKLVEGATDVQNRALSLLGAIVDAASQKLSDSSPSGNLGGSENQVPGQLRLLLDYACKNLRASIVSTDQPIDASRAAIYLKAIAPILWKIGSYALTYTGSILLEMLETLLPCNPKCAFDLAAHAMQSSAYHPDSLVLYTKPMLRIANICLADHGYIFECAGRREALIDCLDILKDSGSLDARRLLAELPSLL